jgi:FkbM family methyltransferase
MQALLTWMPDWKTAAVATVLRNRRGDFVDVGANVGQTLLDFVTASVPANYIGFEPSLVCCEHLSRLIADNGLSNCRVVPAALGDRSGVATLYRGSDVDAGATMLRELRPAYPVEAVETCVFRLDDLEGISAVSLIKIDVEGGELEALRGMRATIGRHQPWIICEVLDRDQFAEAAPHAERRVELMKLIQDMGYSAFRIGLDDSAIRIAHLEPVTAFPVQVWNDRSATRCDYLFVPVADAERARELLVQ